MLAAQNGNLEITKLLCAHPDIQLQTKDNVSYIRHAIFLIL